MGPHVLLYSRPLHHVHPVRAVHPRGHRDRRAHRGGPRARWSRSTSSPGSRSTTNSAANVIDLCPVGRLARQGLPLPAAGVVPQARPRPSTASPARATTSPIEHNNGPGLPRQAPHEPGGQPVVDHRRGALRLEVHPRRGPDTRARASSGEEPFDRPRRRWPMRPLTPRCQRRAWATRSDRSGVMVSPMLSCEDAYLLATMDRSSSIPRRRCAGRPRCRPKGRGQDVPGRLHRCTRRRPRTPGACAACWKGVSDEGARLRGVRQGRLGKRRRSIDAVVLTGNYPSDWVTDDLKKAVRRGKLHIAHRHPSRPSLVRKSLMW